MLAQKLPALFDRATPSVWVPVANMRSVVTREAAAAERLARRAARAPATERAVARV